MSQLPDLAELAERDAADGIVQRVVGAVIDDHGRILLLQRTPGDFRGDTWELPSGKVDGTDADLYAALHREVAEETGLAIAAITGYLGSFDYTSGSGKPTRQHTWAVTVTSPDPVQLSEHDAADWVTTADQRPASAEVQQLLRTHLAATVR
jgi:8-oxo-dGTP diphosphatase